MRIQTDVYKRQVISPSYNTYRQKADTYDADYLEYLLRIPPLVATYAAYSTGITASRLRFCLLYTSRREV